MIPFSQAYNIVFNELQLLKNETEIVSLINSSGRTLAEDIISDTDLPPFNNSAMDGFAVRYEEGRSQWEIIGEITAGNYHEFNRSGQHAVQIMTGAEIPPGYDTVIPVEDVDIHGHLIKVKEELLVKKGQNVRLKGDDLNLNSVAVRKGTLISSRHVAVAAACGRMELKVFKMPVIGILATGDELIDPSQKPAGDKIRATNNLALFSAASEMKCSPVNLGIIKDEPEIIRNKILDGLTSGIDMLVTTGGVSVGKSDFVKLILEEIGVDIKFRKISIKPGKPVVFGVFSQKGKSIPVFGLPGNPVSSLVVFNILIRDVLNKIFGGNGLIRINAALKNSIRKNDDKRHFERGILEIDDNGNYHVLPLKKQSSGNMIQMSSSNCLIELTEQCSALSEGDKVQCILI